MRNRRTTRVVARAGLALALAITGCSTSADGDAYEAEPLLARHGLAGMNTAEIIDHLDRQGGDDRPTDLMASVRPDELVISSNEQEFVLDIPDDRFYLSFAPYVDQTHECFYHSLTTCTGELASAELLVQVVDTATGEVLVDETRTTFENGFVGLWLPRDMEGTLRVSHDGKTGEVDITTDDDAPTCVTTLQLT